MKEKFKKRFLVMLCFCLFFALCTPSITYAKTNTQDTKLKVKAVIKGLPSVVAVEENKTFIIKGDITGSIPKKCSVKVSSNNKNVTVTSAKQQGKQFVIKLKGNQKGKAKLSLKAYYNKKCTATRYITVHVNKKK